MKTLILSNGEVRLALEFDDLTDGAKDKVLWDQASFEVDIMDENSYFWPVAKEMEELKTPWFLESTIRWDHESVLIENIKANEYFFDPSGELLPITYWVKNNKTEKMYFEYSPGYVCEFKFSDYDIKEFAKLAGLCI